MKNIYGTIMAATVALVAVVADAESGRPWGVAPDGTVWTDHSARFINAPALKFADVQGATAYLGEVIDDFHRMFAVTSATSVVSLEPVRKDLPVGYVTVICRGGWEEARAMSVWVVVGRLLKDGLCGG